MQHQHRPPFPTASLQAQLPLLSMEAATAAWRATLGAYAGDVVECASCGTFPQGACFVSLQWCRGEPDDEVIFYCPPCREEYLRLPRPAELIAVMAASWVEDVAHKQAGRSPSAGRRVLEREVAVGCPVGRDGPRMAPNAAGSC